MPTSMLTAGVRAPARTRRGAGVTLEALTADWSLRKRDGRTEPFKVDKVRDAVSRCLVNSLLLSSHDAAAISERIATRVVNFLDAQGNTSPAVEDVQRTVIHQLWADGQADAAEQYTLYREERRKARAARPIPAEVVRLINADVKHFPTPLQAYQFYSKFARWREDDQRRETWAECNLRVFDFFATVPQFQFLKPSEVEWLRAMMFNFKASPAMRVVQMAGPALARCHMGAYNCTAHPIIDLFAFAELLYILMQGSGAGFSVESDYIGELPRVKKQKKNGKRVVHEFVIPDSTEGWCDAIYFGLQKWFAGEDVNYDYSKIRPAGARLKTKGGRASGPSPLRDLLNFTRKIVLGAQGRQLTDLEVHDICCMIGKIVQVGGVRRASCISLSDLDSVQMRSAKHGSWWTANGQRSMANNSAVYEDEKPPIEVFMEEWLALMKSGSGERGIFNRVAAQAFKPSRRKLWKFLCNPCAEIHLRPFQCCNLTIVVLRGDESVAEIMDRLRAATYFGVLQSCCTNFRYVRKAWKDNCEEERLLGVDIMGHLDHPLLKPGAPGRKELVARLKAVVHETAEDLSKRFGINLSAANTCLKPGGDSSVFFDTTTLAPYYAQQQIRRTREAVHSPVCKMLQDQGVPWEPASEDEAGLVAFAWPKKNRDGCITRDHMTAIDQLENWLFWQTTWAEHSCSVTIYVRPDEWLAVGAWCWEHFDRITGLSFLPWDNGTYRTPPNEALTEEQYRAMVSTFPAIDWSQLLRYELEDMTVSSGTLACTGDKCGV